MNSPTENAPLPPQAEPADGFALPPVNVPHLTTRDLLRLDKTFRARIEETRQPAHRLSRLRLWLIFLLVRYAGLRLGEVLHLNDETDINLQSGLLRVSGSHSRDILLPRALLSELRQFFSLPLIAGRRGTLTALDPGYVRRNFYARARECDLPPDLASPRALRQSRAVELIQGDMPLPAVQKFLGQPTLETTGEMLAYSENDIKTMTRHYLHREAKLKTSARNVFPGQVTQIRQNGFLVEVRLTSFTGLPVVAVITEESLNTLQLAVGKTVIATVKAPWVMVSDPRPAEEQGPNRFPAMVTRMNESPLLHEIVMTLPEGSQVCSLSSPDDITPKLVVGSEVFVQFKALTVILSVP